MDIAATATALLLEKLEQDEEVAAWLRETRYTGLQVVEALLDAELAKPQRRSSAEVKAKRRRQVHAHRAREYRRRKRHDRR